jgi:aryl-alcohol dehydrogenase-like predicted oxidoreductase
MPTTITAPTSNLKPSGRTIATVVPPVGHKQEGGHGFLPQLALAWVMAKGDDVVPIPGTKSPRRLQENAAAADATLSAKEVQELDNAIPRGAIVGNRAPQEMMALLNK